MGRAGAVGSAEAKDGCAARAEARLAAEDEASSFRAQPASVTTSSIAASSAGGRRSVAFLAQVESIGIGQRLPELARHGDVLTAPVGDTRLRIPGRADRPIDDL